MEKTTAEAQPYFTYPLRQIVLMLIVIILVVAGGWFAFTRLETLFFAKPWLNGTIGLVFVLGVASCFLQVLRLMQSITWVEGFVRQSPGHDPAFAPSLLAPLAALLRSRGPKSHISSTAARSILDSVGSRMDEARDVSHYLTNLLIFLGLLGTFYGLATTVPALVDTIRSLAPQEGATTPTSSADAFSKLMGGLEAQLGGMGTAFSSSLLGLAGSLVVGLLDLFAGHGQNRFYRELEEWLSSFTRLGLASGDGEGGGGQASAALLEHLTEQMEMMTALTAQSLDSRERSDDRTAGLTAAITLLSKQLQAEEAKAAKAGHDQNALLSRIAAGQEALVEALTGAEGGAHSDAESRMRLRSIDVQLLRILEEISAGRQESMADLRTDLAALSGSIRQLARGTSGRS